MARRFRRRSSRRGRQSGRKTRWTFNNWQLRLNLESDLSQTSGVEWVSFWAKWPASSAPISRTLEANEEAVTINEPVDETLVRTLFSFNALVTNPGTGGVAAEPVNLCMGLIPFDGGEFPSFYDFNTYDQGSLVAPPHPIFQADDDWIIRDAFCVPSEVTTFSTPQFELGFQSKAMRKLPAGRGILFVLGAVSYLTDASQLVTFDGGGDIRMAVRSGFTA